MSTRDVSIGQSDLSTTEREDVGRPHVVPGASEIERGRDLARLEVEEIVAKILRRASEHRLDRGLSFSLPYFDDAAGEIRWRNIDVIPRSRILFVPAFVVQAVDRESSKVGQEAALTESTRAHLLSLLDTIRRAFDLPATA